MIQHMEFDFNNKTVSVLLIAVFVGLFLHGIMGAVISQEFEFYCSVSTIVFRNECPPRSDPLYRVSVLASVFSSLSQIGSHLFRLPYFLALAVIIFLSLRLMLFRIVAALHRLSCSIFFPKSFSISLTKLLRWSRLFNQSPAFFLDVET